MIWRLKGELVFTTKARRNQFATSYATFRTGRAIRLDNSLSLDELVDDEGTHPLPPTFLMDVAFEDEPTTILYHGTLRTVAIVGLVRAYINRHKCMLDPGELPPDPPFETESVTWEYP
jgi:hypothetical protein